MRKGSAIFAAIFLWANAFADPADCDGPKCAVEAAKAFLDKGDPSRAVEVLREAQNKFPEDRDIALLLGISYLRGQNTLWAIRTLLAYLARWPDDCEARAWLAWAYMDRAALDEAWETAKVEGCEGESGARLALVRALVAKARGNEGDGALALFKAKGARKMWPKDREAFSDVLRQAAPSVPRELAYKVEVVGGYTTNALLGSPTDPKSGSVKKGESPIGQADAWVRLAPWLHLYVRPVLELQVKAVGFSASEVRGLSWLDLTGRLGVWVGRTRPRILLGWRPEWLLLGQGDRYDGGPVWYFTAHRGEFEAEIAPWLLVFGGAGHRTFRETARTRFEADFGLGGSLSWDPVTLLWAATGRAYHANASAWNLFGGSVLMHGQVRLPLKMLLKAGITASIDTYPDSSGYAPFGSPSKDRRDVLVKPVLGLFSPAFHGLRVGVQYEYSHRDSSLAQYGFSDHRVTFRVLWAGEAEVLVPSASNLSPLADLPFEAGEEALGLDRIQDLLRQDESVQRSSSCVQ